VILLRYLPRSHALRGNAYWDAPRPAPQSGANIHSHAERGSEKKRRAWEREKTQSVGARKNAERGSEKKRRAWERENSDVQDKSGRLRQAYNSQTT